MKRHISGLLLLLAARPAAGQAIRGDLIEAGTGRPIAGALVLLFDATDSSRANSLSTGQGRFFLQAGVAGSYHLKALRIGFRSWISPAFRLDSGQVRAERFEVPVQPVVLTEIRVEGKSPCRPDPDRSPATAALWDEAKKALDLTDQSLEVSILEYRTRLFRRRFDPRDKLTHEELWQERGRGQWPVTTLHPDSLAARGYVQPRDTLLGPIYYGPDAAVLFSEAFLRTHCFRLVAPDSSDTTRLGLAFEPVKSHKLPDISGVLWLDRASAELRTLEYRYTRLWSWVPPGEAGGRIDFTRLPSGAWIVGGWRIRAPVPRTVPWPIGELNRARDAERPFFGAGKLSLFGFREEGGEVMEVLTLHGLTVWRHPREL